MLIGCYFLVYLTNLPIGKYRSPSHANIVPISSQRETFLESVLLLAFSKRSNSRDERGRVKPDKVSTCFITQVRTGRV